MKTQTYKSILFIGTIIALVSCAKQLDSVDTNISGLQHVVLAAGTEDISSVGETKVYFSDWSTYQLSWANQDKISVFSSGVNYEFSNTANAGQNATFEGDIVPASSYIALYPYRATSSVSSNVVSTVFPSEQSAVADGTDKAALVAVATADAGNLSFKNVYGIVKFEIIDDDVTSVMLEGNDGEVLAGNIDITVGENPSYVVTGNPATEILLTPDGRSTFAAGDYAIAVLPVEFAHGFKLIFTHEGSVKTAIKATKDQAFTVVRNGGLNAKEMDFETADYKYYYIRTKEDLDAWNADYANWGTSDKVYLANDVDYNGTWVTQTASGTEFRGTFDGRGHSITNIHMTSATEQSGFLRRVTGTVKNLTIGSPTDDSDIRSTATSSDRSMGVVALLVGGTIDKVVNYADVIMGSNTAYCGGIAGRVQVNGSVSATISNCTNYGSITCTTTRNVAAIMGGVVGYLETGATIVSDCFNYGSISFNVVGADKKANIGGIVGQVTCAASITGCNNGSELVPGGITVEGSSTHTSGFEIGGIIGFNQTANAEVSYCANYAAIANHASGALLHVGGIAGGLDRPSTIAHCDNYGDVLDDGTCTTAYGSPTTDGGSRTGGILGSANAAANVSYCTNRGQVANNSKSVYMAVSGILGLNAGTAATIDHCINVATISSTPVATGTMNGDSDQQVIRIAGILAKTSVTGVKVTFCENYGDVTLSNSYKVLRSFQGGAVGYTEGTYTEDGKYYATISRGSVGGGNMYGVVGRNASNKGSSLINNGFGGKVGAVTITADNYESYMFSSAGWEKARTGNYFLGSKPTLASMVSPRMSIDSDNNPW